MQFITLGHYVQYSKTIYKGRAALKLQLTPSYQQYFLAYDVNITQQDNGFLELPNVIMNEGFISVDIAAVRNSYYYILPSFSNLVVGAFAGLKFRIQPGVDGQQDAIEMRTANGLLNNPVPVSALTNFCAQLSAPPVYIFSNLLSNASYSAPAQIAEGEWFRLNILIRNNKVTASTGQWPNGNIFFNQVPLLGTNAPGTVGLWVQTGSDAYFSNFRYIRFS